MKSASLRERIELLTPTFAAGDYGRNATGTKSLGVVRADVEVMSARELERAKSFGASTSIKVTIRHNANVTEKTRIKWGSRELLVNSVIPDRLRTWMTLYCAEVK